MQRKTKLAIWTCGGAWRRTRAFYKLSKKKCKSGYFKTPISVVRKALCIHFVQKEKEIMEWGKRNTKYGNTIKCPYSRAEYDESIRELLRRLESDFEKK